MTKDGEVIVYTGAMYKFSGIEGIKSILGSCKLKFTSPVNFNDIYDCNPYIDDESLKSFSKNQWITKHNSPKLLPPGKRLLNKTKIEKEISNQIMQPNYVQNLIHKQKVAICCLARAIKSNLLWSHYAENHAGAALEFVAPQPRVTDLEFNNQRLLGYPVRYRENRIRFEHDPNDPQGIFKKTFLYKSQEWQYEQEIRVIRFMDGEGFYPFSPRILKSVILGVKTNDDNKELITRAVDEFNKKHGTEVTIKQAQIDKKSFSLNIDE